MTKITAAIFPGQGSQSIGMLSTIANVYPQLLQTFKDASAVLGYDLWELAQSGPVEKLNATEFTQPALLTASYGIWQILKSNHQFNPQFLAGHSLGEYTALVCADAISFQDAVALVAERGKLMAAAVPPGIGAMAAIIGLAPAAVEKICQSIATPTQILSAANFNSLGQIVIAGHTAAVAAGVEMAKAHGAKLAKVLAVSVPSHCALMHEAALKLQTYLEDINIQSPTLPIINNVAADIYATPAGIREGLVKQLYSPVRWVDTMAKLVNLGVERVIECGPGMVLTGLCKRDHRELELLMTDTNDHLQMLKQIKNEVKDV